MLRIDKYAKRQVLEEDPQCLPRLVLPFHLRQKSRFRATLADGSEAALFLPRGSVLRDGDLLEAEDGTLVRVESAPEHVLIVTAETQHALMRASYHLGNRHTPVELGENYLKLEVDPVLKEMLLQLGLTVREENAPFQPEPGAYGGGHRHRHNETFAHDCERAHQVFDERHGHAHSTVPPGAQEHSHDDPNGRKHS